MKRILIFLIILLNINIYSQDKYASPFSFTWGASPTPRVLNIDSFSVNKFMLGFQWSGTAPLMNKMLMNSTSGSVGYTLDSTGDNQVDLLHEPIWFSRHPYTYTGTNPHYRSESLQTNLIVFSSFGL
jgi:hypothetical protein